MSNVYIKGTSSATGIKRYPGNRVVGSFFQEKGTKSQTKLFFNKAGDLGPIQTKLKVGQAGDKYEKEADAMADKVVQRLHSPRSSDTSFFRPSNGIPSIQTKCAECSEEEVQKKEEGSVKESTGVAQLHLKTLETPEEEIQTKCENCENEVQAKAFPMVQRKGGEAVVSSSLEQNLAQRRGGGRRLSTTTQNSMEGAFGTDFSQVRIHTDSVAVQMNKELNAQAFTHGNDIYFNRGKYNPYSRQGRHLLAHELTHTIQQGKGVPRLHRKKLTETEKLEDLQSDFLRDDTRLQVAFDNSPIMRYGERSNEGGVKVLQRALKELGYDLTISFKKTGDADGIYGD